MRAMKTPVVKNPVMLKIMYFTNRNDKTATAAESRISRLLYCGTSFFGVSKVPPEISMIKPPLRRSLPPLFLANFTLF